MTATLTPLGWQVMMARAFITSPTPSNSFSVSATGSAGFGSFGVGFSVLTSFVSGVGALAVSIFFGVGNPTPAFRFYRDSSLSFNVAHTTGRLSTGREVIHSLSLSSPWTASATVALTSPLATRSRSRPALASSAE